ncbi:E3 ubiquitin-protein ligase TRIM7-like [Sphaerodactylus townsendi]|uniref:E3 ubiquitin-protein ligase TRIM7-like n=1 Tax=Sphaerodactylus townsendi TaxID=933632 RepID=UPI002026A17A|nr:E3 ubiquitin-protein ligase TRIM7-like [Sphaerodactylus townsendi]
MGWWVHSSFINRHHITTFTVGYTLLTRWFSSAFLMQAVVAARKGRVCQKHQEALNLFCKDDEALICLVCVQSKKHKDHKTVPLEEGPGAVVASRKGRLCQNHQEPLKLFCKKDGALICWVCDRSKEHRDHETLPLEEASQEYKDQFCNHLKILKKERERIVGCTADVSKEALALLKQMTGEKQKTVKKFRELHSFLEKQEKRLLDQIEEVEKEIATTRDQHWAELSKEHSHLDSLIQEIQEKCQQPASDLLWDARSTLKRCEEKETFANPVTFPHALKKRISDYSNQNLNLESIMKQITHSLDSGLQLQKANVTLDPDAAHPRLILSEDRKSMRLREKVQTQPNNPERFNNYYCAVWGREGFTGGRHFWEVLVGSEGGWSVGVARKSVRRKGHFKFSPEGGIWEVGKWRGGHYWASRGGSCIRLSLHGEPKRVRVCLNYDEGQVTFFNADQGTLIHEYSGASFSGETLLPFFQVLTGHLKLC